MKYIALIAFILLGCDETPKACRDSVTLVSMSPGTPNSMECRGDQKMELTQKFGGVLVSCICKESQQGR